MRVWQRVACAAVSSGLAALAFPSLGLWPMALVAWVVLGVAVRESGFRLGFRLGFLHGLILYGSALTWLTNPFGYSAVGLWGILALFTGLACGLIGWVTKQWAGRGWLGLFAACVWLAIEYYRCEWFVLRFPWITPGMALGPTWISPYLGIYGASFLVVLGSFLVSLGGLRQRWCGGAVLLMVAVLGVNRPSAVQLSSRPGVAIDVVALQSENNDFWTYLSMSKEVKVTDTFLLWPEYAITFDPRFGNGLEWNQLIEYTSTTDTAVIFGVGRTDAKGNKRNESWTVSSAGILGMHEKNRPVHLMNDGQAGRVALPVPTRKGLVGTPICFDCDYTEVIRQMTIAGAEFFLIPSMDAKSWGERQHLQHAELFRHRALENNRWMVVASTSGVTQWIDPNGVLVAAMPVMEEGVLFAKVYRKQDRTFFVSHGWVFPWLVCVLAVIWLGALLFLSWLRYRRWLKSE